MKTSIGKNKVKGTVIALGVLTLLLLAVPGAQAFWSKDNCQHYSQCGLQERYVYGGCMGWIDNNVWDSPSTEGCDCSDYVPRCICLPVFREQHENSGHPYNTASLWAGIAKTVKRASQDYVQQWDFFVYDGAPAGSHTGMINGWDSSNYHSNEARGAAYGICAVWRSKQFYHDNNSRYYTRDIWN